jgi:hypothetical protein
MAQHPAQALAMSMIYLSAGASNSHRGFGAHFRLAPHLRFMRMCREAIRDACVNSSGYWCAFNEGPVSPTTQSHAHSRSNGSCRGLKWRLQLISEVFSRASAPFDACSYIPVPALSCVVPSRAAGYVCTATLRHVLGFRLFMNAAKQKSNQLDEQVCGAWLVIRGCASPCMTTRSCQPIFTYLQTLTH